LGKTHGYKIAIEKWMSLHTLAFRPKNWKTGTNIRKRVYELTGQLPQNKFELKRWWKENEKYLIWSENSKKLVVDLKAKIKKSPASENLRKEITADHYWYLRSKEQLLDEWQDEAWIYGQAYIGDSHGSIFNAKIHVSASKDRKAKRNGFIALIREYAYRSKYPDSPKLVADQNKDHLALSEDGKQFIVR
jgi:hypothetical protein